MQSQSNERFRTPSGYEIPFTFTDQAQGQQQHFSQIENNRNHEIRVLVPLRKKLIGNKNSKQKVPKQIVRTNYYFTALFLVLIILTAISVNTYFIWRNYQSISEIEEKLKKEISSYYYVENYKISTNSLELNEGGLNADQFKESMLKIRKSLAHLSDRMTEYEESEAAQNELDEKIRSDYETKFRDLNKKIEANKFSLKAMVTKIEQAIRNNSEEIHKQKQTNQLPTNGVLLWKISNFHKAQQEAMTNKGSKLFSDPFYTSKYGYKMCLYIFPNGNAEATGKFLSIYFLLLQSEWDNILQWPFTYNVTISVLNQLKNDGSKDNEITFAPTNDDFFKAPTKYMHDELGWGWSRFISMEKLKKDGFLMNDELFIKAVVD